MPLSSIAHRTRRARLCGQAELLAVVTRERSDRTGAAVEPHEPVALGPIGVRGNIPDRLDAETGIAGFGFADDAGRGASRQIAFVVAHPSFRISPHVGIFTAERDPLCIRLLFQLHLVRREVAIVPQIIDKVVVGIDPRADVRVAHPRDVSDERAVVLIHIRERGASLPLESGLGTLQSFLRVSQ
jgi:hypothetical protein